MSDEDRLIERLRRIEAIYSRPGSDGERVAAEKARERIIARLAELEKEEPAVEFTFRMTDEWEKRLFLALLRRYGIKPYRYRGQRRTTVIARVSTVFVNETLWPEYQALAAVLREYLEASTAKVVAEALQSTTADAEEREPIGAIND